MAERQELQVVLRTVAEGQGAQQTANALRQVGQQAATTSTQTRQLTAGLASYAAGFFTLTTAASALTTVLTTSLNTHREAERVARATAAAYGANAQQFTQFAQALSATTGFTSQAILEAALSARTLSANYGLTIQQTQNLIRVSADLARVRGIGVAESFERVQSAIRGEAEASEYLGLTLNDTFLKNNALNGSVKNTFERMTDAEKAQIRYDEVLRQTALFKGLATNSVDSLDAAILRADASANKLQLTLGKLAAPAAIFGLQALEQMMKDVGIAIDQVVKKPSSSAVDIIEAIKGGTVQPSVARNQVPQADLELAAALYRQTDRPPAQSARQIAYLDQRNAAVRDLLQMQRDELNLQTEINRLHTDEAQALMQVLPMRQQIAQLERQIADQVDRRVQLQLESQHIAAQQRAAPAQAALEDTERALERNRLLLNVRGISAEQRSAARREIRDLTRIVAPQQRLAAFDAEAPILNATRQQRAFDLASRAGQIPLEQQLVGLRAEARPGEDAVRDIQQSIERQEQLVNISAARTDAQQQVLGQIMQQAIEDGFIKRPPTQIQIQVLTPEGQVSYEELIEAADQADMPPVVRVSGVRR